MTRWRQVYWLPDDACSVPDGIGSGSTTVTVTDMQGSFFILGIGNRKSEVWLYYCLFFFILPAVGSHCTNAVILHFLHITFLLHFIFEFLTQRFTFSSRHYCCVELCTCYSNTYLLSSLCWIIPHFLFRLCPWSPHFPDGKSLAQIIGFTPSVCGETLFSLRFKNISSMSSSK